MLPWQASVGAPVPHAERMLAPVAGDLHRPAGGELPRLAVQVRCHSTARAIASADTDWSAPKSPRGIKLRWPRWPAVQRRRRPGSDLRACLCLGTPRAGTTEICSDGATAMACTPCPPSLSGPCSSFDTLPTPLRAAFARVDAGRVRSVLAEAWSPTSPANCLVICPQQWFNVASSAAYTTPVPLRPALSATVANSILMG